MAFSPKPGEEVIYRGHPSWRGMAGLFGRSLALGVLLALLSRLAGLDELLTFLAILIPLLFAFALGLTRRIGTVYTVTSHRLNVRRGTFAREIQETRLDRVHRVRVAQSPFQRLTAVGDVAFDTSPDSSGELVFEGVGSPVRVVERVDRAAAEHLTP